MGERYCHLKREDRLLLGEMLEKRYSKARIAEILGVHRSTLYREIKRNRLQNFASRNIDYLGSVAHRRYLKRRKRTLRLLRDNELRHHVHAKLRLGWSPWQIEGRLKRDYPENFWITHETIYRYIYSDNGRRNCFYQKLRRSHFRRIKLHDRNPRFPKALSIHNRSVEINHRNVFGHWECDLMIFKRGTKANLITLRERKTRYLIAIKNENKTARGTALAIIATINTLKNHIKSMTFDQGSEFHRYLWIKDCLETDIYFCDPASPYQKGAIENGNGVIRCEFPRSCDLGVYRQKDIDRRIKEINARPMKCLGFQTPEELFNMHCQTEPNCEDTAHQDRI
jgi:IS30 family transposase